LEFPICEVHADVAALGTVGGPDGAGAGFGGRKVERAPIAEEVNAGQNAIYKAAVQGSTCHLMVARGHGIHFGRHHGVAAHVQGLGAIFEEHDRHGIPRELVWAAPKHGGTLEFHLTCFFIPIQGAGSGNDIAGPQQGTASGPDDTTDRRIVYSNPWGGEFHRIGLHYVGAGRTFEGDARGLPLDRIRP
jgi:hypothetical protein